ncbi:hypothetical protein K435DRAFT_809997 [Dendrothele bispora CBS 962.96]|uniref:Uncharacterized protein n=1 Tax=Dendrothele bispora (strain CBS 962.96) TaxID=1314807 RepID=A0A4S8KWE9_DENBC|nr:hypothetical protein K435DRAFT_809997 [Dendrothele bispora CBS 962.96]
MPLSANAYSMLYDASERVRKVIAPVWIDLAHHRVPWDAFLELLAPIANDLKTLSLAAATSETPLPTLHMMTVLNHLCLKIQPPDVHTLPPWALDDHRLTPFKQVIQSVAGSQAFGWSIPLPQHLYGSMPDPFDIPLFNPEDVAPPPVPQSLPSTSGPSRANNDTSSVNTAPANDSRQKSVDRQISDKATQRPKPKPSFKKSTARPSNLPGEPPVVVSRPSVVIPVNNIPKPIVPEADVPKATEDKSGEDTAPPDDSLASRRTPRAAARFFFIRRPRKPSIFRLKTLESVASQRPRESSSEGDDEYKDTNADSSAEESLAAVTKKQHLSKETSSSKASSSKDAGSSKQNSTAKNVVSGSSKKTTAVKDTKKKPAAKKAKTPAPAKIDKGKRKAVSENPENEEEVATESPKAEPDYDLPGKVVNSAFLKGRSALVTADLKKLEAPPSFPGLETLPYLTSAEYIAQDAQHARLFPVRPGRAASTTEKDYPDVFIASHRLGAGYSLKDLVQTTRNIGAVRQVIADNKTVTCATCAAGAHTKTCVPMGIGLPCVACCSSGIPCSLNSELDRLEVSSRTGYEVFAQCSPVIANQLRRINATTYSFVAASGLADTIKFNLGSEIAVLRNHLSNPARVFHQLKAADKNLKITPELISNIGQLAGWTVSYSKTDFLAQPAPADKSPFHPAAASSSERTTVPLPSLSDYFLPIGNKPTPIDISQWVHFMDAQNPLRPEINSALKAGVPYPPITLPSEGLSVSDVAIPTAVHPGSVDSPVDLPKAVTSSADAVMASPVAASTLLDAENTPGIEENDEASSRDEDATKAFDQSLELGTPDSVIRSSPPIAILPQEKDEDNHANNNDDEDEQDIEEDLTNQLDSSPIRPSTTR